MYREPYELSEEQLINIFKKIVLELIRRKEYDDFLPDITIKDLLEDIIKNDKLLHRNK